MQMQERSRTVQDQEHYKCKMQNRTKRILTKESHEYIGLSHVLCHKSSREFSPLSEVPTTFPNEA
jgi:hypothetical protein